MRHKNANRFAPAGDGHRLLRNLSQPVGQTVVKLGDGNQHVTTPFLDRNHRQLNRKEEGMSTVSSGWHRPSRRRQDFQSIDPQVRVRDAARTYAQRRPGARAAGNRKSVFDSLATTSVLPSPESSIPRIRLPRTAAFGRNLPVSANARRARLQKNQQRTPATNPTGDGRKTKMMTTRA